MVSPLRRETITSWAVMRLETRIVYSFLAVGDGQGAHVRALRARSGALGVPAERPRGDRGAAPSR